MNDQQLIAMIGAGIDEDERAALQCQEHEWRVDGADSCEVYVLRPDGSMRTIARCGNGYEDDFSNVIHIANYDPARVLVPVLERVEERLTEANLVTPLLLALVEMCDAPEGVTSLDT